MSLQYNSINPNWHMQMDLLWKLKAFSQMRISLLLTWVVDSSVPARWERRPWCYHSRTHTGPAACGILGTDWPGLRPLFAGGNGRTRQEVQRKWKLNVCLWLFTTKRFPYCARLHVDGGELGAVFLKVLQSAIIQLSQKQSKKFK